MKIDSAYSVSIDNSLSCIECGWPVLLVCCNGDMGRTKPYSGWDWWMYCSNKTCDNHEGSGVFQSDPSWVERTI